MRARIKCFIWEFLELVVLLRGLLVNFGNIYNHHIIDISISKVLSEKYQSKMYSCLAKYWAKLQFINRILIYF